MHANALHFNDAVLCESLNELVRGHQTLCLEQDSTNFFWKGPESKYIRLCRPRSLSQSFNSAAIVQKQPKVTHKWMGLVVFQ